MDTGPGAADGEALRPARPTHDIDTRLHQEAGYSRGYEGFCRTCDWVGPIRPVTPNRRGWALKDAVAHQNEMKAET